MLKETANPVAAQSPKLLRLTAIFTIYILQFKFQPWESTYSWRSWIAAQEGQTQASYVDREWEQALTPFSHSADTSLSDKKAPRALSLLLQTHNNDNKNGVLQHKESMGNFMPSCLKNPWWRPLKPFLVKLFLPRAQVGISLAKAKSTRALTARICHPSNKSEQGKEMAKKGGLNCGKKNPFQPTVAKINLHRLAHSLFKSFLFSPPQS